MQKFSFLSDTIYYQSGQEIEVHSKVSFDSEITIQITSSYLDLDNKFFQLKPNDSLVFKYKPKNSGFIKAIRVFGTTWDFDGVLDVDFKIVSNETSPTFQVATPTLGTSEQIVKTYYEYQGWTKIELFKNVSDDEQYFDFWLSEHNGAYYSIVSSDKDFVIETPSIYFTGITKQFIQITKEDLTNINLCLKIQFGGNVYELQGAQNIAELEQELYFFFANDSKIQVFRQGESILIYSDYLDKHKMKFHGVHKSFNKVFQGIRNDKKNVRVKVLNRNWSYKKVEFDIIANGLVRRPKMIVHFENKNVSSFSFETEKDLVVGEKIRLYLNSDTVIGSKYLQTSNNIVCENNVSMQEAYNKVFWYVEPISTDDATFTVKDVLTETFSVTEKPELLDIYHSVQVTKDEVILTLYLSKVVNYDYDYELSFRNKISKENVDFQLTTTHHKINAGQLDKKERIVWTTSQSIRSFEIVLDGKVIPVNWFDRNYYPNNISLRNNDNVRHFVNRAISRPLYITYQNESVNGNLTLLPNQTDWTYQCNGNTMLWRIFDQDQLILEQTVSYIKAAEQKPYLRMLFNENINAKSINYLTLKLDWPVKHDVDITLAVNSNTDINASGKYRIKADQTELKIRLTPVRLKSKPTIASLQIVSANIEHDNKKYSVIIT